VVRRLHWNVGPRPDDGGTGRSRPRRRVAVGHRRTSRGRDTFISGPDEDAVFHVGSFEMVWTLTAVYWAVLLAATVAVLVLLARGRDSARPRN
jgi:hypothetical protein